MSVACCTLVGMSVPSVRLVKGVFRALATRDGEARRPDGQPYTAINGMGRTPGGVELFEIQFLDGMWMLVEEGDLEAL